MPYLRFDQWVGSYGPDGIVQFDEFFRGVAHARYVVRRVIRIVDEQAKRNGLDPLEHQLLIQVYGSENQVLRVSRLAERLDVPAALASRLVNRLAVQGFVGRRKSDTDRRVTEVYITEAGKQKCIEIWEQLKIHIDYFQQQLDEHEKQLALGIFGFYVGVALDFESPGVTT